MNKLKADVEEMLGYDITEEQFEQALECALRKQARIRERTGRPVVLLRWYLVKLTAEYITAFALSKITVELYRNVDNMEKEHLIKDRGALPNNHIVNASTL